MEDRFQFGIEEELFLADAITRGTPGRSVKAFHAAVRRHLPKTERELLQSQIEIDRRQRRTSPKLVHTWQAYGQI